MKKLADNILCWCENPEEGAIQQAINISKHRRKDIPKDWIEVRPNNIIGEI